MKKKNINTVIIGAGKMATEYVKVLKSLKFFKVTGILSRSQTRVTKFAKLHGIKKIYKNISEINIDENINFIIITPSAENVGKVIFKMLNSNPIILAEKPLGLSYVECKKTILHARKHKLNLYIGLNRRFYPSTIELLKTLNNNIHQKKKRIVEVFDSQNRIRSKKIQDSIKVTKSLMYANSVHLIDYFNIFCRGKIKSIKNFKNNYYDPDIIFSILKFSSGDEGYYHCVWNQDSRWKVKVSMRNFKEWTMQPLESLKEFDNKLHKENFNKKYKYSFKPGLYESISNVENKFFNKKNNLHTAKDHIKTLDLIRRIYDK